MSDKKNLFRQLGKRNKAFLARVLGSAFFLWNLTLLISIPVLPFQPLSDVFAQTPPSQPQANGTQNFEIVEATIEDIQKAITTRQITTTDVVNMYLERIKAYNGTCVNQPEGILGPVSTIPNAGQINALMTLNLRPLNREAWGFNERKARSMTDQEDNNPDYGFIDTDQEDRNPVFGHVDHAQENVEPDYGYHHTAEEEGRGPIEEAAARWRPAPAEVAG